MNKEKEEILDKTGWKYHSSLEAISDKIYEAMDEYAKQQAVDFSEWKEKYAWWCEEYEEDGITKLDNILWSNSSVIPQNITTEELYNLYLTEKNKIT